MVWRGRVSPEVNALLQSLVMQLARPVLVVDVINEELKGSHLRIIRAAPGWIQGLEVLAGRLSVYLEC